MYFPPGKKKEPPMRLFTILFVITFIALYQINTFSQEIPNAGFENWTNGSPDSWYADNVQGFSAFPVTQSTQSHSGSSAAKVEVISNATLGIWPGFMWSASVNYAYAFPVSQAYGSLTGFYQYNGAGQDIADIVIVMSKYMTNERIGVGAGEVKIRANTNGYTQFVIPINYPENIQPDSASIYISIGDSTGNEQQADVGGFILVDDLAFGGVVGVNDKAPAAESFQLKQNYPNPFNPSTTIEFSVPEESSVELKVYNILGVEVASLASGNYSPGDHKISFNGENLASGIYLAKIIATAKADNRTFTKTVKMTLLK
jgi:Secretion system C-terminal sorting domain